MTRCAPTSPVPPGSASMPAGCWGESTAPSWAGIPGRWKRPPGRPGWRRSPLCRPSSGRRPGAQGARPLIECQRELPVPLPVPLPPPPPGTPLLPPVEMSPPGVWLGTVPLSCILVPLFPDSVLLPVPVAPLCVLPPE
ncbi:Conserved oligomeric Golgi complex component 8 [Rhodovastum atsumiense]|nr:Conserved oligomeric Golgi complex component 8 [Rhodovastum atsumiense]